MSEFIPGAKRSKRGLVIKWRQVRFSRGLLLSGYLFPDTLCATVIIILRAGLAETLWRYPSFNDDDLAQRPSMPEKFLAEDPVASYRCESSRSVFLFLSEFS